MRKISARSELGLPPQDPVKGSDPVQELLGPKTQPASVRALEVFGLAQRISKEAVDRKAWQSTGLGVGNALALQHGLTGDIKQQDEVFDDNRAFNSAAELGRRAFTAHIDVNSDYDAGSGTIKIVVEDDSERSRFISDMKKRQTMDDTPLRESPDGKLSFNGIPVEVELGPVMMSLTDDGGYGPREKAEYALIGVQKFARNLGIWTEAAVTHGDEESTVSIRFRTENDRHRFARRALDASKHEIDVELGESNVLFSYETMLRLLVQTPLPE